MTQTKSRKVLIGVLWAVVLIVFLSQLRDAYRAVIFLSDFSSIWKFGAAICVLLAPLLILSGIYIPTLSGSILVILTMVSYTASALDPKYDPERAANLVLDNYILILIAGLCLITIGFLRRRKP